jgi:hypothetical protein
MSGYVSVIAEEKLQKLNATFFEKPVPLQALGRIISEQQLSNIQGGPIDPIIEIRGILQK